MKRVMLLGIGVLACGVLPPAQSRGVEVCHAACENLRRLHCEEGLPTEGGSTCEQVCEDSQGTASPLPAQCVSQVESCAAVPDC